MYKHCNNCDEKFKTHPNEYKCMFCGSYDLIDIEEERPKSKSKPKSKKQEDDEE